MVFHEKSLMRLRILFLFCILINTNSVTAKCLDPVPNEYLIVTTQPEQILSSLNISSKIQNSQYIYNHRKNKIFFKTKTDSIENLNESTLILTLKPEQLKTLEALNPISISQNCFVEPLEFSVDDFLLEPLYSSQWGLKFFLKDLETSNIDFMTKVTVAISDTGFDKDHEDLISKLWINDLELNGQPGVDDDNNGCIDDIHGCDVTNENGDLQINTYKSNLIDHGSHVAGIVGANSTNREGIAGAGFNTELMLIKSFSSRKRTTAADLLKSVYYAVDNKADILNCSWGTGSTPTMAEYNAFEYARINGVIVVVAAGNSAIYASRTSPAGLTNVLTVGSHNSSYQLSTFSNFGDSVDILAPGGDGIERKNDSILSLGAYSHYMSKKGTSMSAPFVVAALANIKSAFPNLNRKELINILLLSAEKKAVSGYFDPKYQDELLILNLNQALLLAQNYSEGLYSESLDYEPKEINKPSATNIFENTLEQRDLSSEAQGSSGCSSAQLKSEAKLTSILFLLIPLIWLQIKKRTLK